MLRGKVGMVFGDVVAGFANDFQIADDGIAGFAVCHESGQVHATRVFLNVAYCFKDVLQVVRHPQRVRTAYTAMASRST